MVNRLWLSMFGTGTLANRPTNPDLPDNTSGHYFATDTGVVYNWNPATKAWQNGDNLPILAAAGTTQLGATAITGTRAVVTTATASTHGVLLPTAVTGLEVEVANQGPTFGVKVWPNAGDKVNLGTTNAADTTVLAKAKTTRYIAVNGTNWITLRGA